jgi:hypothetical protein
MAKYNNVERRFSARVGFVVPGTAGNYATEVIDVVPVGPVQAPGTVAEIVALAEGSPNAPFVTGVTVELWLARMPVDGTPIAWGDFTLAGTNFTTLTAAGAVRWAVPGWHRAQVRVKAGVNPVGGTQFVSVSAT